MVANGVRGRACAISHSCPNEVRNCLALRRHTIWVRSHLVCLTKQTFLETVSTCLLIKELELSVDNCALAIGKPRMSGKRAGKTVEYRRERTEASRNGRADT